MAYVTKDKRVKPIIDKLRLRRITALQAREQIQALPPEPGHDFSFLEWEIDEAIEAGLETKRATKR